MDVLSSFIPTSRKDISEHGHNFRAYRDFHIVGALAVDAISGVKCK